MGAVCLSRVLKPLDLSVESILFLCFHICVLLNIQEIQGVIANRTSVVLCSLGQILVQQVSSGGNSNICRCIHLFMFEFLEFRYVDMHGPEMFK